MRGTSNWRYVGSCDVCASTQLDASASRWDGACGRLGEEAGGSGNRFPATMLAMIHDPCQVCLSAIGDACFSTDVLAHKQAFSTYEMQCVGGGRRIIRAG